MIEYKIEVPAEFKFVKKLWKKFFKKDQTWHYTLEGSYIEIRVEKRHKGLEKYLDKNKAPYTRFKYQDNIPITRKYQKQYEKIFHGFTELAMKVKRPKTRGEADDFKNEMYQTIERCVHLVFNINGLNMEDEAKYLSDYAVKRAWMAGKIHGEFNKQLEKEALEAEPEDF